MEISALKLVPAYKDYIWGGKRLKNEYKKNTPFEITAESWELSCHKNGLSFVTGGEYDGMSLMSVIENARKSGVDFLGTNCAEFDSLPVLIKLIDANDSLSIQVHPDDAYAELYENGSKGKTEVWYVVDAEPGAELVYGFSKDITKAELKVAISRNELKPYLNCVEVKAGDVFFVPAGLLHAIGKGILICEIQQNSDTTYRVYDWGRVGADGRPRELHIEKAVDVVRLLAEEEKDFSPKLICETPHNKDFLIAECKYFKSVKRIQKKESRIVTDGTSFVSIVFLSGEGKLCTGEKMVSYSKGDSFFIPALPQEYTVFGECEFIITKV